MGPDWPHWTGVVQHRSTAASALEADRDRTSATKHPRSGPRMTQVRQVRDEEAVGSNPATPTQLRGHFRSLGVADFAQWVTN
jgi:hypothetical protein